MTAALSGIWTIASIELRQRVRGSAWYVLLGVFVMLTLVVTIGATLSLSYAPEPGSALYSIVVYFVLLLVTCMQRLPCSSKRYGHCGRAPIFTKKLCTMDLCSQHAYRDWWTMTRWVHS